MTANELADELGNILTFLEIEYENYEDDEILKQAATMLRQQQAEIEALKLRELSDEEIMQVCSQIEPFDDTTIEQAFIEFARAILKKASDK